MSYCCHYHVCECSTTQQCDRRLTQQWLTWHFIEWVFGLCTKEMFWFWRCWFFAPFTIIRICWLCPKFSGTAQSPSPTTFPNYYWDCHIFGWFCFALKAPPQSPIISAILPSVPQFHLSLLSVVQLHRWTAGSLHSSSIWRPTRMLMILSLAMSTVTIQHLALPGSTWVRHRITFTTDLRAVRCTLALHPFRCG